MSIIVEILLWSIIALGAVIGIHSGFIKMAAKPVKLILALVIAFSLCSAFTEGVIIPIIEKPVTNYIYEFLCKNCPDLSIENITEELPTVLKMAAGIYNVNLEEMISEYNGVDILLEITETLANPVIEIFSMIISFVILYVLSKLLISLALTLLDIIFNGGVFGALNRVLGGVSGAILALAVAWGVAVIIEFLFHINSSGMENAGLLYTFFNTYSPIEILLSF